jgi:hypothetical protein
MRSAIISLPNVNHQPRASARWLDGLVSLSSFAFDGKAVLQVFNQNKLSNKWDLIKKIFPDSERRHQETACPNHPVMFPQYLFSFWRAGHSMNIIYFGVFGGMGEMGLSAKLAKRQPIPTKVRSQGCIHFQWLTYISVMSY